MESQNSIAFKDKKPHQEEEDVFIHVSNLRRAIPQLVATMALSLLQLSIGMIVASPTIVIGAIYKKKLDVSFDDYQASWFGSILLLCQPVGSIASLFLTGFLGRRRSMLLVNFPLIIGWYLLYLGESVQMLFTSAIISGITIGFMEAPTLAYIGEVSEPRLRGTFTSITNTHVAIGHLLEFLIATLVGEENWRTAMLISIIVPVITIVIVYQVPESPVWLLSQGRNKDALESLCWLRGWVEERAVAKEFQALMRYNENSKRENGENKVARSQNKIYKGIPTKAYINSDGSGIVPAESVHPPRESIKDKLKDICRPAFYRPLRLILLYVCFTHAAGMNAIRPYMIEIFGEIGLPINPLWVTVWTATLQITGGVSCILLVHRVGKRKLSLISITACAVSILSIGVYTYFKEDINNSWIPMFFFATLFYSLNLGVSPIPWMLISEVFPQRGRGAGGGISAAVFYSLAFVVSKTYFDLNKLVNLYGVFFFYGSIATIGIVFFYFCLPETEGKTLPEIEQCFVKSRFTTSKKDNKVHRELP